MHTALIALHAGAGVLAFGAGCLALARGTHLTVYLAALAICIASVVAAVALGWSDLDPATRVVFGALSALGAFMLWRGRRAHALGRAGANRSSGYIDHLGFTLVGLLDAFAVIAVLDLGAPGWAGGAVGAAGAIGGHYALAAFKARRYTGGWRPAARW